MFGLDFWFGSAGAAAERHYREMAEAEVNAAFALHARTGIYHALQGAPRSANCESCGAPPNGASRCDYCGRQR